MQTPELFVNISPGEYLFYSSKPQTLQIHCHKNTSFIAVQHSSRLRLDDNCEVRSEHFITRAGPTFYLTWTPNQWKKWWRGWSWSTIRLCQSGTFNSCYNLHTTTTIGLQLQSASWLPSCYWLCASCVTDTSRSGRTCQVPPLLPLKEQLHNEKFFFCFFNSTKHNKHKH